MAKAKQRNHNEWFRSVSLGGRKSCPECREKLAAGEKVWAWGNYVNAKWRNVSYFCRACFAATVRGRLADHTAGCGCAVTLVGYHVKLPDWLTLEPEKTCALQNEGGGRGERAEVEGDPARRGAGLDVAGVG